MKLKFEILTVILTLSSVLSKAQKLVPCNCGADANGKRLYGFCDSLIIKDKIPCQYDSAYPFNGGLARVIKDGKTGYVDQTGKLVIPFLYEEGEDFSDGFAYVKKGENYFYINKTGVNQFKKNFPIPSLGVKIEGLSEGAKKILAQQMSTLKKECKFNDGLAKVFDTTKKMIGFIDTKGATVLPTKYIYATSFSEGIAFVKESPTQAITAINKKGVAVFELGKDILPNPEGFINGFAIVRGRPSNGNFAVLNYIDKSGKLLLAESVNKAQPFSNNYAVISDKNNDMFLIDNKGMKVFDQTLKYLEQSPIKGILFYSNETDRGYGLMDFSGNRRTKPGYVNFKKLNDSIFLCKPWGSSAYTLLSIKSGELLFASRFTAYNWLKEGKKSILRLTGDDLFGNVRSLDYEPATGKYLKEGKEIPANDNLYLAINYTTDKDKTQQEAELKPGVVKYENQYFSLRFPKEMELFKDTVDQTTYRQSTYYFSVKRRQYTGSARDYLDALMEQLKAGNEYESVVFENLAVQNGSLPILIATKKETGNSKGRLFYTALDSDKTGAGKGILYVLFGNYFAGNETKDGSQFRSALYSISYK